MADHVATPLTVGETVSSSSDKVTVGKEKAIASGLVGTAVGFLSALGLAASDGTITGGEWIGIASATVLAFAAAFGITYAVPASVTRNQ